MSAGDPFHLQRFLDAQAGDIGRVRHELKCGQKRSHWMWFIFPQVSGLGHSAMAERFAISSLDEAKAYLAHPILGPRLIECTELVIAVTGRPIEEILGAIDALKFRSCMTLFAHAAPEQAEFKAALDRYYGGEPDPLTLARL